MVDLHGTSWKPLRKTSKAAFTSLDTCKENDRTKINKSSTREGQNVIASANIESITRKRWKDDQIPEMKPKENLNKSMA